MAIFNKKKKQEKRYPGTMKKGSVTASRFGKVRKTVSALKASGHSTPAERRLRIDRDGLENARLEAESTAEFHRFMSRGSSLFESRETSSGLEPADRARYKAAKLLRVARDRGDPEEMRMGIRESYGKTMKKGDVGGFLEELSALARDYGLTGYLGRFPKTR